MSNFGRREILVICVDGKCGHCFLCEIDKKKAESGE